MEIKPIKTETDYTNALKRLEIIFSAEIGTTESDEADVLGLLIDEYEKKHYPIEPVFNTDFYFSIFWKGCATATFVSNRTLSCQLIVID